MQAELAGDALHVGATIAIGIGEEAVGAGLEFFPIGDAIRIGVDVLNLHAHELEGAIPRADASKRGAIANDRRALIHPRAAEGGGDLELVLFARLGWPVGADASDFAVDVSKVESVGGV